MFRFMRGNNAAVLVLLCLAVFGGSLSAEVTLEQRKELTELKKSLGKVSTHIRKKEFDEAAALMESAEAQATAIAAAAGVELTDKSLLGIGPLLERNRKSLDLARGRAGGKMPAVGVSFAKDVAPIIADNCLGCHGAENPRANLRLDTFAGWIRGGQRGPLAVAGNAGRSLIMARLVAPDPRQRMPRGEEALSREEIQTIAAWIDGGAAFDGASNDALLADLAKGIDDADIVIPKPTGKETVSFTRDIAPFMANLCVRCHSGDDPRGGLSLVSFHDMMRGGDSGQVVLPGDREGSRLFRLTGGLENPRMPQGQGRITRKNYEDLKKWFEEGNTFDGPDAKAPLRSFIPSEAEMAAAKFAKLSPEEFNKMRIDRAESQWKRALPNDEHQFLQSDDLLLYGNVSAARLQEVEDWAEQHLQTLKKLFGSGDGPMWKGRLAIFVLKDRFSYDEFNQVIEGRRTVPEMTGHSVVSAGFEDAYVALEDVGDVPSSASGGLKINLIDHLTGAYLKRGDDSLPDWLIRGTGLALAAQAAPANPYFRDIGDTAAKLVVSAGSPEAIFAEGTFSPGSLGPIGYTLVEYMLESGGQAPFVRFVQSLESGSDQAAAMRAVYNTDLAAVARGYLASLAGKKRR